MATNGFRLSALTYIYGHELAVSGNHRHKHARHESCIRPFWPYINNRVANPHLRTAIRHSGKVDSQRSLNYSP